MRPVLNCQGAWRRAARQHEDDSHPRRGSGFAGLLVNLAREYYGLVPPWIPRKHVQRQLRRQKKSGPPAPLESVQVAAKMALEASQHFDQACKLELLRISQGRYLR